jgi:murein DD-endopeptidase MepM/ murein hydrolase activator NlpD
MWPILKSPLPPGLAIVTSGYTDRRVVGASVGSHGALDFAVKRGTPVYAVAGGIVKNLSTSDLQHTGRYVLLEHNFSGLKIQSRSIHLERVAPLRVGQHVQAGQMIGTVGSSGSTHYGPHLHLDIRVCGAWALAAYKKKFGWPVAARPSLVSTAGCYVVPAEPLVAVDGYTDRVIDAARAHQIPLARDRRPPRLARVATAVVAGGLLVVAGVLFARGRWV